MQNTNSCPDFDGRLVPEITVAGARIRVKGYRCSADGCTYPPKQPPIRLMVSILLTRRCDAGCPFCIARPGREADRFDFPALERILAQLAAEDRVLCVSVTGGEPFLEVPRLNEVLKIVFRVLGEKTSVSVSTNGSGLHRLGELENLEDLATVHISRHHWDDRENDRIFGRTMPTAETLRHTVEGIPFRDLFVMNCMLLRGAVDSPEKVHRFLDFALETGVPKVAFMTATPVNEWTASHRIPFPDVIREDDPDLMITRGFTDRGFCSCRDGLYVSPAGRVIELYGRHPEKTDAPYCRGLVITPEGQLLDGFGGRMLFDGRNAREKEDWQFEK